MSAIVGRHNWKDISGATFLSAYTAYLFKSWGFSTSIVSTYRIDLEKINSWYGIDLEGVSIYYFLNKYFKKFRMYQTFLFMFPLKKAIINIKPDVIFVDNEYYKNILPLKRKYGFRLFHYIHFPYFGFYSLGRSNIHSELVRYLSDIRSYLYKYNKGFMKIYFRLWKILQRRFSVDNPFNSADVVMTNSSYTAKAIELLWNEKPIVLYPPVMVESIKKSADKDWYSRDNAIVIVGRISHEKRMEDVIDIVAKSKSRPKVRIIGPVISENYLLYLKKLAKDKHVRVSFYTNISRRQLIRLLAGSKVYIHTTVGEHFGISVVEAMAAGLPVIVHKSGGPYEDIIKKGVYGLYYETKHEASELIDKVLLDRKNWIYYSRKSLERADFFSHKNYAFRLSRILGL